MQRAGVNRVRFRLSRVGPLALLCILVITACTPPGLPDPITPSGPTSVPSSPPPAGTVVVGLDGLAGRITGFNPYSIADFSLASQAATSLVLPSVFVIGSDGRPAADPDVIDAASVTSQTPFTVTYTLDRKASWSDGTPITAEDFSYLRDQLLVQPGTIGSAGYRLISSITSRDAGKTVEVQFTAAYPDWQTLFSPLLPSHLMKDSPGGWSGALDNDIPIAGNRYRMSSYDAVTGQVNLARNDKYWAAQPGPVAVALRLGDPADLLAAFDRGDVQALWLAPDQTLAGALTAAVPAERRTVVPIPAATQLVFNTTSGVAAESAIRRAIAAGINPTA
ncbi:MAG: ABC transporter substrate-binding protein, partial [Nakamurella sp.]